MDSELIIDEYRREQSNKPKERVYENKHKIWFPSGLFHQKEFFDMADESFLLYCLFRSHEVRNGVRSKFYNRIKKDYFDKGHIVSVLSNRQISQKTGWYYGRIERYVKKLVEKRWVRIDKVEVGKPRKQNVYILGYTSPVGDDVYFIYQFTS